MALPSASKVNERTRIVQAGNRPVRFSTLTMLSHLPNNRMRSAVIDSIAQRLGHLRPSRNLKFEFASFDRGVLAEALLKTPHLVCLQWSITQDFIFITLHNDPKLRSVYRKLLIRLVTHSIATLAAYKLLSDDITMKELDQIIKGPYTPEIIRSTVKEAIANKLNPSAETKSKTEQSKD